MTGDGGDPAVAEVAVDRVYVYILTGPESRPLVLKHPIRGSGVAGPRATLLLASLRPGLLSEFLRLSLSCRDIAYHIKPGRLFPAQTD